MKIACISASNTYSKGCESTSTMLCDLIGQLIKRDHDTNTAIAVVPLVDYDIKSCRLCGACAKDGQCIYDEDFNKVLFEISAADAVFWVVPHYSPIPSKLLAVFEKINEIVYANWLINTEYKAPIANKPTGIIGHGGMVENEKVLKYYHDNLITPVANTLRSLSFNVIGLEGSFKNGVAFGLKDEGCIKTVPNAVFPEIIQDWAHIEYRVSPLVEKVIKEK